MPYVERPPRAIVCSDCTKTELRSPYGPAPTLCRACGEARRTEAHRDRMREQRSGIPRKYHSRRPLGVGKGTART